MIPLIQDDGTLPEVGTRLLFVCSVNRLRSPTAEFIARRHGLVADSAGTDESLAIVALRDDHLRWATEIVCMEAHHADTVHRRLAALGLPPGNPPVHTWHIPDEYDFQDPRLVAILRQRLADGGYLPAPR